MMGFNMQTKMMAIAICVGTLSWSSTAHADVWSSVLGGTWAIAPQQAHSACMTSLVNAKAYEPPNYGIPGRREGGGTR